ncbi:UNVERIFIED_CONTAM: hypothetical protein Scaly_2971900, partial [Sesamum calycinum]
PTSYNMASSREEGGPEANSTSESPGTPGTPGTPGSNDSDVPEEFLAFRDLICPELFRENVPLDALTSRGLLPHGQTSRVSSIEEVALFMQTVGMHKRQRDNMERFQHSLETINRRFHRVLSALCAMAPELITRPSFTETHARITNNPDFYPFFKVHTNTLIGITTFMIASELWMARWYRHGSLCGPKSISIAKGGLAQNVLAICDFDMNFTYVYAGWEGSAADARVLDHAVSHDNTFPFPPIGKYYLVDAGFTNYQCFLGPYRGTRYHLPEGEDKVVHMEPHRTCLTMHIQDMAYRRYLDDRGRQHTSAHDETTHRAQGHWARGLRRHFGYPYTRDQVREKFYELKRRFNQFHAITQLPGIFYDIETFVMVFPSKLRPRASRSDPGAQTNSDGDSTARSRRPQGLPPRPRDGP